MKLLLRSFVPAFTLFIMGCVGQSNNEIEGGISDVKTPYFGQTPPGLTPKQFAPGIVSTENFEIGGVFSPDMKEFYFARQVTGSPTKEYVFTYKNGGWQQSDRGTRVGAFTISTDGNTMYLGNTYREHTSAGWSEAKSLGPMFEQFPIMRLSASEAGTYVFDERTDVGTIRYSRLIDGERQEPEVFGEEINSGTFTAHPFIAADESYIIWDSERDGGYGGSDLYISFRQTNGSWAPAINMGEAINTPYNDSHGSVTPDGQYFFFRTVNSLESLGETTANIFWVDAKIIENLRPE